MALSQALTLGHRNERVSVLYSLGRMDNPTAKNTLRTLLRDPNTEMAGYAASVAGSYHPEMLLEMDPATVPQALRRSVLGAHMELRGEAGVAVAAIFIRSADSRGAVDAVRALANSNSESARTLMLEAFQSGKPLLEAAALQVMGGVSGMPVQARTAFLTRLAAGDMPSDMVNSLGDPGSSPEVRDALLAAMKNGSRDLAQSAGHVLANSGAPGTADLLIGMVGDKALDDTLRGSVFNVLNQTPGGATAVVGLAKQGNVKALAALSSQDSVEATNTLLDLMASDDKEVADAARSALQGNHSAAGSEALSGLYFNGNSDEQLTALDGLRYRSDERSRSVLLDAAASENPEVQAKGLHSLGSGMADDEVEALLRDGLRGDGDVFSAAMSALHGRSGNIVPNLLGEVLRGDHAGAKQKQEAAIALRRLGGAAARDCADLIDQHIEQPEVAEDHNPVSMLVETMPLLLE